MAQDQAPRRERRTCAKCGKVGYYPAGQAAACKQCGAPLDAPGAEPAGPAAAAAPTAWEPLAGQPPQPQPATAATQEPPLGFAVGALACGLASLASVWVFPMALLLGVGAIALGSVALSRHSGDTGVQLMSIIGIVAGSLGLLFALFLMPWLYYESGSSYSYEGGGSGSETTYEEQGSGGGGGGSSGGGGGGAEGGGGSSGGGGGGGAEVGVDTSVDSPLPVGLLMGLGILLAAAWRRRA